MAIGHYMAIDDRITNRLNGSVFEHDSLKIGGILAFIANCLNLNENCVFATDNEKHGRQTRRLPLQPCFSGKMPSLSDSYLKCSYPIPMFVTVNLEIDIPQKTVNLEIDIPQ